MKIWFNTYPPYQEDVKIGINWYKHKRKEWKGFTFSIILIGFSIDINYVNNYKEYLKFINYRFGKRFNR